MRGTFKEGGEGRVWKLLLISKCEKGWSHLPCSLASFLASAENVTMALLHVHYLSRTGCLPRQGDAGRRGKGGIRERNGHRLGRILGEIDKQGKRWIKPIETLHIFDRQTIVLVVIILVEIFSKLSVLFWEACFHNSGFCVQMYDLCMETNKACDWACKISW